MGYQNNLFNLNVMNDRSGRAAGRMKLPVMSRSECEGGKLSRQAGKESCAFINCRYNLVGEAMRIKDMDTAANVQTARWEGKVKHTCTLDFAELDEGDDELIGGLMGIPKELVPQRIAEAAFKMREMMRLEHRAENAFAGLDEEHGNEMDRPAMATSTRIYDANDEIL